ncbi:transcriptional regulator, TetR family [Nannocystis exedens]|uniref:Transcriptional regulator, TetR family n=1 Tax=Nannocystis exedens TaxID=54 RepID=A0A1I1UJ60_9BACT|nr:TetR family transcriptional regulator [Nannocystis exedens]PCC71618.1 TetR family transcriptional regulator [Nannocystis exedens]SFD68783.1 transcriptional regulator, TetR family [Nannocystis exedens]
MAGPRTRHAHATETRELILTTAERLFAEHGVAAVSNRQISEAAGQANNFAVGYHFGTKTDLVTAIVRRHAPAIEHRRMDRLRTIQSSQTLRDWLGCLVLPTTEYLASLGSPSWYARFIAQATTDPALRQLVIDETTASASMGGVSEGLKRLMPVLPADVVAERSDMSRHLIVHVCAERERALQEGTTTPRATWEGAAIGLIDALVGLWQAPFTPTQ